MKMKNKTYCIRTIFCILFYVIFMLPGAAFGEETVQILATSFPAYDFARQIVGNDAKVRLLLPPGSESHSYEPTPQDMIAIQNADLFLITGGESEHWVMGILAAMDEKAPQIFAMMDCVTALADEKSQSMQEDVRTPKESHTHTEVEFDEHVWTSPKNAKLIVSEMVKVLSEIKPASAKTYQLNSQEYLKKLDVLDKAIEDIVKNGKRQKMIFGDRFPFRYFAHDYGIAYDAAFPGCSEDSEPNAQTIISLIREIREEKIPVVFYIEFSNRKTADILAEETDAKLLLMHSCHNITYKEMDEGATYFSLMWKNTEALKEALE